MSSYDGLIASCRRLRNADPQSYADFIKEMEIFTAQRMTALCDAPPDGIFLAQGLAKASKALLGIFNSTDVVSPKKPGA